MLPLTRWILPALVMAGSLITAQPAAAAPVQDPDGIFSNDAKEKANKVIEDIKSRHKMDLLIEAHARIPADKEAGFEAVRKDDLAREMSVVARQVKLLLDQKGHDAIAVGEFHGPDRLAS